MFIKIFFITTTFVNLSYTLRISRIKRSSWGHVPDYAKEREIDDYDWANRQGGHDSGYLINKNKHFDDDEGRYEHDSRHSGEQHNLRASSGVAKHASAEAKGGASKHADLASALGKDLKAKTFGYFDYQYKTPEYHVEQFHIDERQGRKFGADHKHHAVKDHATDAHEAAGWGKQGKGYHNDVTGHIAHDLGEHKGNDRAAGYQGAYGHGAEKDYSKGRHAHEADHNTGRIPSEHSGHRFWGHFSPEHRWNNGWGWDWE